MGIQCDECEQWFHVRPDCCNLSHEIYEILANSSCSWICPLCGLPNFSDSFFDNSLHSLCSSNSFDPLNDCDAEVPPLQANRKQAPTKTSRHFKPNPNTRKLTCLVINCRSLKNKIADITAVIDEHKPDVILGNESWLNPEITSSEIFTEGYTVFRKNRVEGQIGGGVFQAIKGDIIATHRVDLDTDCEIIWSQCKTAGRRSKSLFLASLYRPHAHDVKSLDELGASLLKLGDKLHKHDVIVAGDFNAPNISWDNLEVPTSPSSSSSRKLIELTQEFNLMQFVKEPTRRKGNSSNTLDLVLSNRPDIICNVSVEPGISDHDIVLFTLKLSCLKKTICQAQNLHQKAA